MVKGAIIQIDANPFRQWYENFYGRTIVKGDSESNSAISSLFKKGKKSAKKQEKETKESKETSETTVFSSLAPKKNSKSKSKPLPVDATNLEEKVAKLDPLLEEQIASGTLYAIIASRPGQCGRCDGYILEGKELEFYAKKIHSRR